MPCHVTNWHLLVDRYTSLITGNRRKDIFCCLYFSKLGKSSHPSQPLALRRMQTQDYRTRSGDRCVMCHRLQDIAVTTNVWTRCVVSGHTHHHSHTLCMTGVSDNTPAGGLRTEGDVCLANRVECSASKSSIRRFVITPRRRPLLGPSPG